MTPWLMVTMVAGIAGFMAVALLTVWLLLRRLARRADEALQAELGTTPVLLKDRGANFFGVESKGMAQVRGNGVLVLTAADLRFRLWAPERTLTIELSRIRELTVVRSHLGRSKGMDLLKVSFENDAGESDSVAWLVRDLQAWLTQLRAKTG